MTSPTFNETFRAFVNELIYILENHRPLEDFIDKGYQFFDLAQTTEEQSAVVGVIALAQFLDA